MNALYFLVFHQNIQKDKNTKTNLKYAQHIFETTQNCGSNENTIGTLHITIKGTHMNTVENSMSLTSEKKASN